MPVKHSRPSQFEVVLVFERERELYNTPIRYGMGSCKHYVGMTFRQKADIGFIRDTIQYSSLPIFIQFHL